MTQLAQWSRVRPVPVKRRDDRPRDRRLYRINIEVYPEQEQLVTAAKMDAIRRGVTFREWVMEAFERHLEAGTAR